MVQIFDMLAFFFLVAFYIILSEGARSMGIQQNMADIMRMIKQQRGKSVMELSEELEISASTLQDYLKGEGNPTVKMVERLAEKLEIDPIALVSGRVDPEKRQIILLLLDTIQEVSELPQLKRVRFAELFLELVQLWEEDK